MFVVWVTGFTTPFLLVHPLFLCFLSLSFFESHIYTLILTQRKIVPTPVRAVVGKHRLVTTVYRPSPAPFLCVMSAWILTSFCNCYHHINAVSLFLKLENVEMKYGVQICSFPVFTLPPLYGPVVLINNEFQLDTLALQNMSTHTHTEAAAWD